MFFRNFFLNKFENSEKKNVFNKFRKSFFNKSEISKNYVLINDL